MKVKVFRFVFLQDLEDMQVQKEFDKWLEQKIVIIKHIYTQMIRENVMIVIVLYEEYYSV